MIEMPLGQISTREAEDYRQALQGFRSVLGKTLEPLAIRLKINDRQVRAEAALAPLPQLPEVRQVLDNAGGGTVPPGLAGRGPETLFLALTHIGPSVQAAISRQDLLGDWAFLRLEDTDLLTPTAEAWIRQELEPALFDAMQLQGERIVFQLPLVMGVGVKNRKNFDKFFSEIIDLAGIPLGPFERRKVGDYKGVPVIRLQAHRDSQLAEWLNPGVPREKRLLPTVWYAYLDDGWYASLREPLLHDTLDQALAQGQSSSSRQGGRGRQQPGVPGAWVGREGERGGAVLPGVGQPPASAGKQPDLVQSVPVGVAAGGPDGNGDADDRSPLNQLSTRQPGRCPLLV